MNFVGFEISALLRLEDPKTGQKLPNFILCNKIYTLINAESAILQIQIAMHKYRTITLSGC